MTLDLSKIPKDIIDKHIIPYSYSPQPAELVKDIKTFHLTLTKMFEMFYEVYREHPYGKPGIHTLLKLSITEFLSSKENTDAFFRKILWRIPTDSDAGELYMIRKVWACLPPVVRLQCMMHYYRYFTNPTTDDT
tara:strand:+ start:3265 stop:3666 length:402 start_codon:yes stop_codon:yes gene_type:complete